VCAAGSNDFANSSQPQGVSQDEATPEEITSILRQRIEEFDVETNLAEVGAVLQLGDGIARVHGLENCVALELLELDHDVVGIAFNLEEDNVGVALFGDGTRSRRATPSAARQCRLGAVGERCSAASSIRSAIRSTARARLTSRSAAHSSSRRRASSSASR